MNNKTLPDIAYSFGNVFEYQGSRYKFTQWGEGTGKNGEDVVVANMVAGGLTAFVFPEQMKDLKLIGLSVSCLAEMAREKGEGIDIEFYPRSGYSIVSVRGGDGNDKDGFQQRDTESLEEFCLRVARLRQYV